MTVFVELDTCRSVTMSMAGLAVGAIPWTAIEAYARHLGLTEMDKATFMDIVLEIDRLYLIDRHRSMKKNKGKGEKTRNRVERTETAADEAEGDQDPKSTPPKNPRRMGRDGLRRRNQGR